MWLRRTVAGREDGREPMRKTGKRLSKTELKTSFLFGADEKLAGQRPARNNVVRRTPHGPFILARSDGMFPKYPGGRHTGSSSKMCISKQDRNRNGGQYEKRRPSKQSIKMTRFERADKTPRPLFSPMGKAEMGGGGFVGVSSSIVIEPAHPPS
jgi:hypothetical protein